MENSQEHNPEIVHRRCGGWLAYSSRRATLRIGVTGTSAEEVTRKYHEAVAAWKLAIAAGRGQ